ncbi:YvcK family protein [bacterium]|nr:YvcK family protein [bacterium]
MPINRGNLLSLRYRIKHNDIVTIGNGTGQGVILQALRKITGLDRVTAIVGVTDNGGHTGALRIELDVPAMGDVKTVISALTGETVWGQLVRHRFRDGNLKGISIGNMILAALMDEGGSLYHATRRLSKALDLKAHIVPVSETNAQVVAELADGTEIEGEWESINRLNREAPITGIHHNPEMETNNSALKAIDEAEWIIICPGTLWLGIGSILASPGIKEMISKSDAIVLAIGNGLTQPGVTDGLTASNHLDILENMLGRKIDFYLQHDRDLPEKTLANYMEKGFRKVVDDLEDGETQVVRGDLVSQSFIRSVDRVHYDSSRGYPHAMRHDPAMLARIFIHVSEATEMKENFATKPKDERWEVKDF